MRRRGDRRAGRLAQWVLSCALLGLFPCAARAACKFVVIVDHGATVSKPSLNDRHTTIGEKFDADWGILQRQSESSDICYVRYYKLSLEKDKNQLQANISRMLDYNPAFQFGWRRDIDTASFGPGTVLFFMTLQDLWVESQTGPAVEVKTCQVPSVGSTLICDGLSGTLGTIQEAADLVFWKFVYYGRVTARGITQSDSLQIVPGISCAVSGQDQVICRRENPSWYVTLETGANKPIPTLLVRPVEAALAYISWVPSPHPAFDAIGVRANDDYRTRLGTYYADREVQLSCQPASAFRSLSQFAVDVLRAPVSLLPCGLQFRWQPAMLGSAFGFTAKWSGEDWIYSIGNREYKRDEYWPLLLTPKHLSKVKVGEPAQAALVTRGSDHVWFISTSVPEVPVSGQQGQKSYEWNCSKDRSARACAWTPSTGLEELAIETGIDLEGCICLRRGVFGDMPAYRYSTTEANATTYYVGWKPKRPKGKPLVRPPQSCSEVDGAPGLWKCTTMINNLFSTELPICPQISRSGNPIECE